MIEDVFCKILDGELKGDFVHRDDSVAVLKDIHPQAPVHLLVMPVKHYDDLADMMKRDPGLVVKLMDVVRKVADQEGLEKGYRLILNEGVNGGKLVPHLHFHLLGGKRLGPKIIAG